MDEHKLVDHMMVRFGPTLGGEDLYAALGFKTYASFHRSKLRGELGIHVFKLQGRKGWFALTDEVADWLEKQSRREDR